MLGESFSGIGVTDDYAAYKSLFSQHQLCWAHLIRKAIKLALQNPDETEYAEFLDALCSIYDDARELRDGAQPDGSGKLESGKLVKQLQSRVTSLCNRRGEKIIKPKTADKTKTLPATSSHLETFILLQRELAGNLDCLFIFVEHPTSATHQLTQSKNLPLTSNRHSIDPARK